MSAELEDSGRLFRARRLWLVLLIALGAGLRAFRLSWWLPDFIFADSILFYVKPATALLLEGKWEPTRAVHTPTMGYIVAAAGALLPETVFGLSDFEGPYRLTFIGRIMTVVFSTASIPAAYLLGRRLAGTRAALLGAAAFAVTPLHVLEAHRINSDALMMLLWLLAAHRAVMARDSGRSGSLWAAFALAGASGAVKYTGLVAGAVPAWIALTWNGLPLTGRVGKLIAGCFATLTAFLIGIVPLLLVPDLLESEVSKIVEVAGRPETFRGDYAWWFAPYLYPLMAALPYMLGWATYLSGLCGVAVVCRMPRARGPLLAALIPFFLLQGAADTGTPRYYLPLAPFLCIAAGIALDALWRRQRVLGPVAAAVVLGYSALLTASQCARIEGGPGRAITQELRRRLPAARSEGRRLTVAYPSQTTARYDPVGRLLRRRPFRELWFPAPIAALPAAERVARFRAWLDREGVDVVIVTSWSEADMRRRSAATGHDLVSALESGEVGFALVRNERTRFLTQDLYDWADPAFDTQETVGVIGYKLFERTPSPFAPHEATGPERTQKRR